MKISTISLLVTSMVCSGIILDASASGQRRHHRRRYVQRVSHTETQSKAEITRMLNPYDMLVGILGSPMYSRTDNVHGEEQIQNRIQFLQDKLTALNNKKAQLLAQLQVKLKSSNIPQDEYTEAVSYINDASTKLKNEVAKKITELRLKLFFLPQPPNIFTENEGQ